MEYVLPLFIGTQFLKLIFDFIIPEKQKIFTVQEIMFMPYGRIIIQQFTVILAMFFMVFINSGIIAAILLLIFRGIFDFFIVGIRENEVLVDKIVDKLYNEKATKEENRKQLLLFSE